MNITDSTIICNDDNIDELRSRYPEGLRFVVGDTHGQFATLRALMQKIKFDPEKDHVFFVGDYNAGGNVQCLLDYISLYYEADYTKPGFHLIRGNHERELHPIYTLEKQPDIIVIREKHMTYYIVHAGMMYNAFNLINSDIAKHPEKKIFSYKLDDICVEYDAPLRQLIWSRNGLYSQRSHYHIWPNEENLRRNKACIIHGHSPYCFFKKPDYFTYGGEMLFWQNQRIFFSEALQSFNIDSNIKGRSENGEAYRGLACVCIEAIEEIAAQNGDRLTVSGVKNAPNFVFSMPYIFCVYEEFGGDIKKVINGSPEMKLITLDEKGMPVIKE